MYTQTLRFSSHIAHNPPLQQQQQKGAFSAKSELEFSNPSKRVSNPSISCRKTCHLAAIRCSGSQKKQEVMQEGELDDGYYMRRCVEIARKAIGCTSPNPMVGCVIVKDGKIVGEGFHPKAGQPHAEVFALRDAGDLAENATAYVSLEPCNHYGRTPPCTEALIKAKVKKVVVGMVDPNPIVASMGVKRLRDAGIEVTVAVEEESCKRLNEAYIHHILTKTPFVTLRYSMSLDGNILNQLGEEATEYGGYYSKLLQEYDALILCDTAVSETSSFPISKEPGANQPLKILLSKSSASKITIISTEDTSVEPQTNQEEIQASSLDRINLLEILEHCKNRGVCSVLIDLRDNNKDFEDILKEGFEQNLFQKVVVEVLPVLGGGPERNLKFMDLNVNCKKLVPSVCGKVVLLEGYF